MIYKILEVYIPYKTNKTPYEFFNITQEHWSRIKSKDKMTNSQRQMVSMLIGVETDVSNYNICIKMIGEYYGNNKNL